MKKITLLIIVATIQFVSCTGSVESSVNKTNTESDDQPKLKEVDVADAETISDYVEEIKENLGEVQLSVVSSTTYFSPGENESDFLSIQLVNNTGKSITLPKNLLKNLTLTGQGSSQRFPLTLNIIKYPESSIKEEVTLQSGEKIELIRFSYRDLFYEHKHLTGRDRQARWIWDWEAAMMAPPSPMQTGDSFENEVVFSAELMLENKEIKSEKITLDIRP
ncbi:MAG: hypothetical protein EA412_04415 [Chitinophagaceae bacterium]|nr:MAG: hypothetical protein EA412_04415 [Chitinophagaceae bacterium]